MDKDVVMADVSTLHLWIFVGILGPSQRDGMKNHVSIRREERYLEHQSTSSLIYQIREKRAKDRLNPNRGKHIFLVTPGCAHMCLGWGSFTSMDLGL